MQNSERGTLHLSRSSRSLRPLAADGTAVDLDGAILMVNVAGGLELDVDRGPNWLFVKLQPSKETLPEAPLVADELWSISSRHFIYRLVLELDQLQELSDGMVGELVSLQERLTQRGGSLRLCGLSPECEESLHECHVDSTLRNHSSRAEAVLG